MLTPRAFDVKAAAISAAATAGLFLAVAAIEKKTVEWRTVKLWALGSFFLMYIAGI